MTALGPSHRIRSRARLCCVFFAVLFMVAGCASSRAPVEYRVKPGSAPPGQYYVTAGDTLFKIAWRFGVDYRELAAINDIPQPYTIFPGQKLVFKASAPSKPQVATAAKPTAKPAPTPRVIPPAAASSSTTPAFNGRWIWPSEGTVIRGYSGSLHKGIDIDGSRNDPIRAVAAGEVVYAGTGIAGYGRLLIIKHDDTYLSAYGHNESLVVAEGARVSAGQLIARKGDSGTNRVKLHFEIRRKGKPVDPISVLGKR
jgi:lipoprotein NlpD